MTRPFLLTVILVLVMGANVSAQEQVVLKLVIGDTKNKSKPRFSAPNVRYELRDSQFYDPADQAIKYHSPTASLRRGKYTYREWPLDKDEAVRQYAHFVFDDLYIQDYFPVNEFLLSVQLSPERTQEGRVETEIFFDNRASIANSYKRQVNELTRVKNPSEDQNLSTYSAAHSAISLSPKTDNFLLLGKALRHSLRFGNDATLAPLSRAQLEALPGYEELEFSDQWTIQTELLDSLTGARDLSSRIDPTRTVIDTAIEFGTEMLSQIDFENSHHTQLRIVRVFQTLSYLHSVNEDCFSLQENNSEAISKSKAIRMNWASQRTLLLDWGTCLERWSGFGKSLTEEQLVALVAGNPDLKQAWRSFADSGQIVESRLALSADPSAQRLKSLVEFANKVQNWRE